MEKKGRSRSQLLPVVVLLMLPLIGGCGSFGGFDSLGGGGGGRPNMAQAGGNDPAGVPKALELTPGWVAERV